MAKTYNRSTEIKILKERINVLTSELDKETKISTDLHLLDFFNISMKMFDWKNLPSEIPKRRVEMLLFNHGAVAFFKTKDKGYYILPFAYCGGINDYGDFTRIRPISKSGITQFGEYTIGEDCVIIRDNELEIPPYIYAKFYGEKISELFNIRQKNNNFLKMPFIFGSSGNRGKDARNALEIKQITQNDKNEVYFITDAFDNLKLFDMKPQYFGREIQEQIKDLKNDFFEWAGIKHLPQDKKERMLVDEVNIDEEKNVINTEKRLEPRKRACEEINSIFNLDIDVEVNKYYKDEVKTSNVVASVSGGIHNNKDREQSKSDRR